jgi:hypothetical protein
MLRLTICQIVVAVHRKKLELLCHLVGQAAMQSCTCWKLFQYCENPMLYPISLSSYLIFSKHSCLSHKCNWHLSLVCGYVLLWGLITWFISAPLKDESLHLLYVHFKNLMEELMNINCRFFCSGFGSDRKHIKASQLFGRIGLVNTKVYHQFLCSSFYASLLIIILKKFLPHVCFS